MTTTTSMFHLTTIIIIIVYTEFVFNQSNQKGNIIKGSTKLHESFVLNKI